jgi:hypothetical protein
LWHTEKPEEARRQLAEADKYYDAHPLSDHAGSWYQRVLADTTRRETQELVADRDEKQGSQPATSRPLGEL